MATKIWTHFGRILLLKKAYFETKLVPGDGGEGGNDERCVKCLLSLLTRIFHYAVTFVRWVVA